MEGRLFLLAIWCGIYGAMIRSLSRKDSWIEKNGITIVLNALFWATAAGMLGMLVASYSERMDKTGQYSLLFSLGGIVFGAAMAVWKNRKAETRSNMIKDNLEWADTGFSAILLASIVMFFVIQAFKIPSGSMRMTFVEGDHLFVNKFIYGIPIPLTDKKLVHFKKIKNEDIVIFRFPAEDKNSPHYGKDFIKRVVALEGQKVEVINKKLLVDGKEVVEPFTQFVDATIYPSLGYPNEFFQEKWQAGEFGLNGGNDIRDNFGPVVVPPGHLFVMGDNRDRSYDSRFWGPLKITAVKGKAWLLYWPFNRFRAVK